MPTTHTRHARQRSHRDLSTPQDRAAAKIRAAYAATTPDPAPAAQTAPTPSGPRRAAGSSGRPAAAPTATPSAGDGGSSGDDPDMPSAREGRDR